MPRSPLLKVAPYAAYQIETLHVPQHFRSPARHWHTCHLNQALIMHVDLIEKQTNYLKADVVVASRPLLHGGKQ